MQKVSLPEPEELSITLPDALKKRHSAVHGNPDIDLTLQECGTLLGLALQKRPGEHYRNYPSGGGLYPIETYVISTALETQDPAVYHYNPTTHTLEKLWNLPQGFDMKSLAKYPEPLPLSTLIVFTSVWARSSAKYGDISYTHGLLEAGHMSENILLVGCALGLNVRPYAGFNDERISELLDLDEEQEQTVLAITVCKG
jgi:SagB-type dehydrogenase family enzyme